MSQVGAAKESRGPGRPRRSPEAVAEQRAHLLESAMTAIRRHGPDVSVEDMASEAGVSKPVLYAAFTDKNGIAEAVAVELVERAEREIFPVLSQSGVTLEATLRAAVEAFFEIVTADPDIYAFVFRSIRTSDRGLLDNALVRSLQLRFRAMAEVLAPDADPDMVTVMGGATFGFVIGAIESWLITQAPARDQLVEVITVALARGLEAVAA